MKDPVNDEPQSITSPMLEALQQFSVEKAERYLDELAVFL